MQNESKLTRGINADFPNNSDRAKSAQKKPPIAEKKVEKIVKGKVIKQKKSLGQKFTETFLGDDTRSVGDYVLHDVLVPALKAMLSDMVGGGMEMLLFGERRSRSGSSFVRDRGRSHVAYGSNFINYNDDRRPARSARARHDFADIILATRGEAEDVLGHLVDLIADYNMATVADYYELVGVESNYTDANYGWTDLRNASVDRVRQGYAISLPQPREIR